MTRIIGAVLAILLGIAVMLTGCASQQIEEDIMTRIISAVLVSLLGGALLVTGCKIPTLSEIVDDGRVLDCSADPRAEHHHAIVIITDSRTYERGDEGWLAVLIKHSQRLSIENASDRIGIHAPPNIEILEAVESELLPYVVENPDAPNFLPAENITSYHVPLDSDYRALVKFRYLGGKLKGLEDMGDYAELELDYRQRIPAYSFGDRMYIRFIGGEVDLTYREQLRKPYSTDYCHPDYWNTLPDDQNDPFPFEHPGWECTEEGTQARYEFLGFANEEEYLEWLYR